MYKKPDFEPSRQEMLEILGRHIRPFDRTETIHVINSQGRICAADVAAVHTLPNTHYSCLDGIAVRFADFQTEMPPDTSHWELGKEYAFSNTGCALPGGYDTVIAIEKVAFDEEGRIEILVPPLAMGANVGEPGANVRENEILVHKGTVITPSIIGILISGGIAVINVLQKPKVAFLPTGDELVAFGQEVPIGKNIESNSIMVGTYLKKWGADPILYPIVPDDRQKLRAAMAKALLESDMVIICAGSSKGTKDFTMGILEELGKVLVHELGHGPGKHCSFALIDGKPVIGLPGPPMGTDLTAVYYVQNALRTMLLQPMCKPRTLEVTLVEDVKPVRRLDFVLRLYVFRQNGRYYARPASPGTLTRAESLHRFNADLYTEKNLEYKAGQTVAAELRCAEEYIKDEQ